MPALGIEPWEPEESVGKLWHAFANRLGAPESHRAAEVELSEVIGRLGVFFRALGGDPSVEIRPAAPEASRHRLGFPRRLAADAEAVARASFDGAALRLPESLSAYPSREANGALYLWQVAMLAHGRGLAGEAAADSDPLRRDLRHLASAEAMTRSALASAPGLRALHDALRFAALRSRPVLSLPRIEAAVEALARRLLGDPSPLPPLAEAFLEAMRAGRFDGLRAPLRYRRLAPAALWPELRAPERSAPAAFDAQSGDGASREASERSLRARRHRADQAERRDSLILYKFEAVLSWAEFLNLNRRVVDDDPDSAAKAMEDQEEIGLGQVSKAPSTRLKLHLDLAPEDVDRERLSGEFLYPEWDARARRYLPDHARVLHAPAEPSRGLPSFRADARASRRIARVRRQFEALRPARLFLPARLDGEEIDMDAAIRSRVDLLAAGMGSDRIWRQSRPCAPSLAVSILLDASRSTESAVSGRPAIDVGREALAALAWGLDACGEDFAIHGFSSLRRDRVYLHECKAFGEPMGERVEARIGGLKPGFYTRLGAAIRHCSAGLERQPRSRRLLLAITDGKPNDLDHYEGRHGIEDTAMAVREARRAGHGVFALTLDKRARNWFPRLFGRGGFLALSHPEKLTAALPMIYRELTGA